jgi:hypothetical protein
MNRTNAEEQPISLHRALADWGEGSSIGTEGQGGGGAPAETSDATWVHTFWDSQTWTTPGGDFEPTASATIEIPLLGGPFAWTSDAMVEDVQAWLDDPTTNFGWLLVGNEDELRTTKRFRSRESPVEAERPTLIVEYWQ